MSFQPELKLPDSFDWADLIGVQTSALGTLGWQLGEHYDATMRAEHGDDWLEGLKQVAAKRAAPVHGGPGHQFKLHDPSFVITEPLMNSSSPLRACLPKGKDFYDLLDEVRKVRNASQHFDPPLTPQLLTKRISVIGRFATEVGLPMAQRCDEVIERIKVLAQGGGRSSGSVPGLKDRVREERERAVAAANEADRLRREMEELRERSRAKAASDAQVAAELDRLEKERAEAVAARNMAEEELEVVRSAVHAGTAEERASAERVEGLEPGDDWPVAPGARILRLMPFVRDLYDPSAEELLSESVGELAVEAAAAWTEFKPNGGAVHLNDAGQACSYIGARCVYLGSLDEGTTDVN